jgi:hypothetical protein
MLDEDGYAPPEAPRFFHEALPCLTGLTHLRCAGALVDVHVSNLVDGLSPGGGFGRLARLDLLGPMPDWPREDALLVHLLHTTRELSSLTALVELSVASAAVDVSTLPPGLTSLAVAGITSHMYASLRANGTPAVGSYGRPLGPRLAAHKVRPARPRTARARSAAGCEQPLQLLAPAASPPAGPAPAPTRARPHTHTPQAAPLRLRSLSLHFSDSELIGHVGMSAHLAAALALGWAEQLTCLRFAGTCAELCMLDVLRPHMFQPLFGPRGPRALPPLVELALASRGVDSHHYGSYHGDSSDCIDAEAIADVLDRLPALRSVHLQTRQRSRLRGLERLHPLTQLTRLVRAREREGGARERGCRRCRRQRDAKDAGKTTALSAVAAVPPPIFPLVALPRRSSPA